MCFAWFTQQSKIIITKNIHINSNKTEVSCCCLLVLLDYDLDYSWLTWARISGLSASRGLFSTYFLSLTLNNKAVKTNITFFKKKMFSWINSQLRVACFKLKGAGTSCSLYSDCPAAPVSSNNKPQPSEQTSGSQHPAGLSSLFESVH